MPSKAELKEYPAEIKGPKQTVQIPKVLFLKKLPKEL
jgi:hypothetical protein